MTVTTLGRNPLDVANVAYLDEPRPPSVKNPWVIRYILADLDGTRMPSYSAFGALSRLAEWFRETLCTRNQQVEVDEVLRDLVAVVRMEIGIERLLHQPEPSLQRCAVHYAATCWPDLLPRIKDEGFLVTVPGLLSACEESFCLFPGAEDFVIRAKAARTAFGIFTATAPEHAVNRMIRAGENPELIQEIWSRSNSRDELAGHFDWGAATSAQLAFINLLRPYKDSKPFQGPLRAVHEQYELAPESVLMIGEGCADLGCVTEHSNELTMTTRLCARFAFQHQGARLAETYAEVNDILRQGHPLGLRSFLNRYPQASHHPAIVILEHGFESLLGMVANGLIVLKPTPPPLRESELAISGYHRPSIPAPQRSRSQHPIEVSEPAGAEPPDHSN